MAAVFLCPRKSRYAIIVFMEPCLITLRLRVDMPAQSVVFCPYGGGLVSPTVAVAVEEKRY